MDLVLPPLGVFRPHLEEVLPTGTSAHKSALAALYCQAHGHSLGLLVAYWHQTKGALFADTYQVYRF